MNASVVKHAQRYEWSTWFKLVRKGKRLMLRKGIHFLCLPHGMRSNIVQAAKRHKLRVSIHITSEGVTIEKA